MHTFTKVGLDALLTPENCAVLLIDHQPSQLANVNSHEPTMVINNVTALAKTAKAYGVPTILTTINAKCGGEIFKQVQAVFPDQKPIDRTFINSWEDRRVVEAVKSCPISPVSLLEINATRSNKLRLDSRNRCDWSAARRQSARGHLLVLRRSPEDEGRHWCQRGPEARRRAGEDA